MGGGIAISGVDVIGAFEQKAIEALRGNELLMRVRAAGAAWGSLKALFVENLPASLEDRESIAYNLVPKALDEILGPQNEAWYAFRNPDRNNTMYVRAGRRPAQ